MKQQSRVDSESLVLPDRLTVTDISRRTAKDAVLAFLAACCAVDFKVESLAEGLQIGNAFQLAGFPYVVGTLWPTNEFTCRVVAEAFIPSPALGRTSASLITNDLMAF